jgi:hypothetical protein
LLRPNGVSLVAAGLVVDGSAPPRFMAADSGDADGTVGRGSLFGQWRCLENVLV